jgi:predicted outer membrane protein
MPSAQSARRAALGISAAESVRMRISSILFLTSLMCSACTDDPDIAGVDNDVNAAMSSGTTSGMGLSAQATMEMQSDDASVAKAKIVSIVKALDDRATTQAQAELQITHALDVEAFANTVVSDDQANGTALASVATPQDNPVTSAVAGEAPTSDGDATYLKMQIQLQQEAFVLVGNLATIDPDDAGLAQFITDTETMVGMHRDAAETQFRAL